jgi:hypothetical protein
MSGIVVSPPVRPATRSRAATRELWMDRMARFPASGLTVAQFCAIERRLQANEQRRAARPPRDPAPMSGVANAAAESTPNSRRDRVPRSLSLSIRISRSKTARGVRKTGGAFPCNLPVTLYLRASGSQSRHDKGIILMSRLSRCVGSHRPMCRRPVVPERIVQLSQAVRLEMPLIHRRFERLHQRHGAIKKWLFRF